MIDWKDKTCKECIYRGGQYCRKSPPMARIEDMDYPAQYPVVMWKIMLKEPPQIVYYYACAEYKEAE